MEGIFEQAQYRDGRKAVEDAIRANELSKWEVAYMLDALAAAYAELGNSVEAAKYQARAITLESDEHRIEGYRARLKLYKSGEPYRQPQD